jgi:hypothetical protein
MTQARRVCGGDILEAMSFIQEHAELDVGHTALNEVMMSKLLGQLPQYAPYLASIGARALDIYLRFMADCVERARLMLRAAAA